MCHSWQCSAYIKSQKNVGWGFWVWVWLNTKKPYPKAPKNLALGKNPNILLRILAKKFGFLPKLKFLYGVQELLKLFVMVNSNIRFESIRLNMVPI